MVISIIRDKMSEEVDKYVRCIDIPPEGRYIKGNIYRYTAVIDMVGSYDEDEKAHYFEDHKFLWYFIPVHK